jgi:hypothetical protein
MTGCWAPNQKNGLCATPLFQSYFPGLEFANAVNLMQKVTKRSRLKIERLKQELLVQKRKRLNKYL